MSSSSAEEEGGDESTTAASATDGRWVVTGEHSMRGASGHGRRGWVGKEEVHELVGAVRFSLLFFATLFAELSNQVLFFYAFDLTFTNYY